MYNFHLYFSQKKFRNLYTFSGPLGGCNPLNVPKVPWLGRSYLPPLSVPIIHFANALTRPSRSLWLGLSDTETVDDQFANVEGCHRISRSYGLCAQFRAQIPREEGKRNEGPFLCTFVVHSILDHTRAETFEAFTSAH